MRITTIGVFQDRLKTETVINELRVGGIPDEAISCLYVGRDGEIKDQQTDEKIEDGTIKGATTGAVVGMIAGLAVANGLLPGLGTLIIGGPMLIEVFGLTAAAATTVGGAVTGAITGGIVGGLVKLGVSEEDAKIFEQNIQKGDVLVITRAENNTAKDVLKKNGASDVREYIEN